MERAFVVLLALASLSPAAQVEAPGPPCTAAQSANACAIALNNLGSKRFSAGNHREAELLFARAIKLWSADPAFAGDLAKALHNLAAVYRAETRYRDAASLYQSTLDLREALAGPEDVSLLPILNEFGSMYIDTANYGRAEQILQRARSIARSNHYEQTIAGADVMNNLAVIAREQGRFPDAAQLYREALAVYHNSSDSQREVKALNNLGRVLAQQDQYKRAERLYRQAIAEAKLKLGPSDPDLALGLSNLGKLLISRRKFSAAEPLLKRAEAIDRETFASESARIGYDLANDGMAAAGRKHFAEAEELYERSLAIFEKTLPPNHPELGKAMARLADAYGHADRWDESEKLYRRAIDVLEKAWGPENPQLVGVLESYESVLRARQDYAEAESVEVRTTKIRVMEALRSSN
jgi:tetratricopeptide (TPR) repeat protein